VLEGERHRVILKILQERFVVSVTELIDLLDSSEATVRGGAKSLAPGHRTRLVGMPIETGRGIGAPHMRAIARVAAC
jgi:DeoR family transcriptional regulator, ulaG and ulaABCDEF operon transcriptional repressor